MKKLRVLVACEYSGIVRDAFKAKGHDAWSCDILPTESPGNHIQGDVLEVLNEGWDMMIAHPPCTHLCVSGARHFDKKRKDGRQQQGICFFMAMIEAPIDKIAVENPVGIMSTIYRKSDQIIHPYYFGDEAQKRTCLWLKNIPLLYHNDKPNLFDDKITHVGRGEFYISPSGKKMPKWYGDPEVEGKKIPYNSDEIKKIRSKTFPGIANAMADQWG